MKVSDHTQTHPHNNAALVQYQIPVIIVMLGPLKVYVNWFSVKFKTWATAYKVGLHNVLHRCLFNFYFFYNKQNKKWNEILNLIWHMC